jgi:hypothetical protein
MDAIAGKMREGEHVAAFDHALDPQEEGDVVGMAPPVEAEPSVTAP